MEYLVKVLNLSNDSKEGLRSSINLLILLSLFTLAILGSWQSGGIFLREIAVGSGIFMFLLLINENQFIKKN